MYFIELFMKSGSVWKIFFVSVNRFLLSCRFSKNCPYQKTQYMDCFLRQLEDSA